MTFSHHSLAAFGESLQRTTQTSTRDSAFVSSLYHICIIGGHRKLQQKYKSGLGKQNSICVNKYLVRNILCLYTMYMISGIVKLREDVSRAVSRIIGALVNALWEQALVQWRIKKP